jgi:Tfp pilus assembly protein PilE
MSEILPDSKEKAGLQIELTWIEWLICLTIGALFFFVCIPNFMQIPVRARQADAKQNLKNYFVAAKAYFVEHGTYVCGDCNFQVSKDSRYTYTLSPTVVLYPEKKLKNTGPCPDGIDPKLLARQTQTGFIAVATANIDDDSTCDRWVIDEHNDLKNIMNDVKN